MCIPLIKSWNLWSFLGVNQTSTTNGSGYIELAIYDLFGPKGALLVVWWVYIVSNTNRNMRFVVILRNQPTFYDKWFRRYWIRAFWPFFDSFWSKKGPLECSDGYILSETLIESWGLRSFWGVNQPTTNRSGDIELAIFGLFGPFWPKKGTSGDLMGIHYIEH